MVPFFLHDELMGDAPLLVISWSVMCSEILHITAMTISVIYGKRSMNKLSEVLFFLCMCLCFYILGGGGLIEDQVKLVQFRMKFSTWNFYSTIDYNWNERVQIEWSFIFFCTRLCFFFSSLELVLIMLYLKIQQSLRYLSCSRSWLRKLEMDSYSSA